MNGIDISRWNPVDLSRIAFDFVIIKATQGTGYVSPTFKSQITQAESLGKLIGVYHYASAGGAVTEAEHFIKTINDYIGKVILVLDWEGEQNANFSNPEYAKAWLAYVEQKTGVTPFIYMSKSVCRQYAKQWDIQYPLWCAQYKNQQPSGYQVEPWTDKKGFGPWEKPLIFQYSSKGQLDGYSGNLDLDIAYMTPEEWLAWARGKAQTVDPTARPVLKRGDHNEYVAAWQRLLNANGYQCGNSDGIFGQRTQDALIRYQQDHGIEAGFVGPQTWATLN